MNFRRKTFAFSHPDAPEPTLIKAYSEDGARAKFRRRIIAAIAYSQGNPFMAHMNGEAYDKIMSRITVEELPPAVTGQDNKTKGNEE